MAIPSVMQAMVLDRPGLPLKLAELKVPEPGPDQMLIKVAACGVCRTDLHILDGELERLARPIEHHSLHDRPRSFSPCLV